MYIEHNSHRISFTYIEQGIAHRGRHYLKPCALAFILHMHCSGTAFCDWTQKKKQNNAKFIPWAFPSESPSNYVKFEVAPKLQITSNNIFSSFSLLSHRTQGLKKCSSFRIELLFLQPSANSFLGGWGGFSKSWLTTVFGHFALQVCCTWYVGMRLNNVYSLASIICGFI